MAEVGKPPIGPASSTQEGKIAQIVIQFDGEHLRVKHPDDPMLCLGMLRLAEHEIISKLTGHEQENKGGNIIIPNMKIGGIKA